jgi:hypothetical protein
MINSVWIFEKGLNKSKPLKLIQTEKIIFQSKQDHMLHKMRFIKTFFKYSYRVDHKESNNCICQLDKYTMTSWDIKYNCIYNVLTSGLSADIIMFRLFEWSFYYILYRPKNGRQNPTNKTQNGVDANAHERKYFWNPDKKKMLFIFYNRKVVDVGHHGSS